MFLQMQGILLKRKMQGGAYSTPVLWVINFFHRKNSVLKRFFLKIKAKKGTKKAAVALARKVLCVLHHLLINREKYQENGNAKSKPVKFNWTSSQIQMTEQDMINVLANAGYIIKKKDARGCI